MKGAILLALAIAAPAERYSDDHVFRGVQFRNYAPSIRVVTYKSQAELSHSYEAVHKMPLGAGERVRAFAYGHPDGVCEIHLIDPELDYQPALLGHELAHCLYGHWHGIFIK